MSIKRSRDEPSAAPMAKKQKRGFQVGPANLPDGSWKRKNDKIKRSLIERAQVKRSYAKLREREAVEPSRTRTEQDAEEEVHHDHSTGSEPHAEPASLELHPDRIKQLEQPEPEPDVPPNRGSRKARQSRQPRPSQRSREAEKTFVAAESGSDEQHVGKAIRQRTEKGEMAGRANNSRAEGSDDGKEEAEDDFDPRQHPSRRRINRPRPKPQPFSREIREAERRRLEAEQRAVARQQARDERDRKLEERERHRRIMAKARTGGKNGQRKLGRESSVLLDKVKRLMGQAS